MQWQGFVFDGAEKQVMHGVEYGRKIKIVCDPPAENYVPRFENTPPEQRRQVEMQLALTDPDFRERAEALAILFNDPEYREAFANAIDAEQIVQKAEAIVKQGAATSETVVAAGEKRGAETTHVEAPPGKRTVISEGAKAVPSEVTEHGVVQAQFGEDRLAGVGDTNIIRDTSTMEMEHQCTH